MRFTTGVLVGLAIGYYLGAKAGRERYEQIEEWLDKVRGTDVYRDVTTKIEQLYQDGRLGTEPILELRDFEDEPTA